MFVLHVRQLKSRIKHGRLRRLLVQSQHIRSTDPPQRALENSRYFMSILAQGDSCDGHLQYVLAEPSKCGVILKTQQAVDFAHDY